jgi:hypothetical protein
VRPYPDDSRACGAGFEIQRTNAVRRQFFVAGDTKFNAYVVELKHSEESFTGNLLISDKTVSANFQKIDQDLYIAHFQTQEAFSYHEKVHFKNREKEMVCLLPVLSKYNKRKLAKLAKLLNAPGGKEKNNILTFITSIDKFVKYDDLLDFFSISREEMIVFFLDKELRKEIKIIDFIHFTVTSYENYWEYHKQFHALLTEYYTGRQQILKFSEIESKIKLPMNSIFFKYLAHSFIDDFSFKIKKDRIVFNKPALSEDQKEYMTEISDILKRNKMFIFTIENAVRSSGLTNKEVNDALWTLLETGEVVQLNELYFIFSSELHKIINRLKKYKRNQGEMIDIQAFRELTLYTRKYIIVLLEYFDSQQITTRIENQRKILLGA